MHDGMTLWHLITSSASWGGGWTCSMTQVRASGSPSVRGSSPLRSKSTASYVLSRLRRDSIGSRIAASVRVPIREVASLPPLPSLLPRFCGGEIGAARGPVTLHVRRCVDTHLLARQRAAKTFAVQAVRQTGRQAGNRRFAASQRKVCRPPSRIPAVCVSRDRTQPLGRACLPTCQAR
ncbi:hypothetical protein LX32DRAFT_108241 [Colletotrichum zoysiae]|uniref:Uncharacterized protein n=1 Tax=Colletotrichum zoysiae TaxID=1216348 RepID=A0AAD9LZW7_9PEZI|nr:hypothetical protein LX32DRAFT_108241 [Colletotrichum zoysiae]